TCLSLTWARAVFRAQYRHAVAGGRPESPFSSDSLRKDAMRLLAVFTSPEHGEEIGDDEERRRCGEQQTADHGAGERGVLLLAGAADRHWQHADDHGRCRHQHWPDPGMAGIDCSLKRRLAGKLLL